MTKHKVCFTRVRAQLRALGLTIRQTDWDEYRIAWPGDERSAYYTPDLADALDTGLFMADPLRPVPEVFDHTH